MRFKVEIEFSSCVLDGADPHDAAHKFVALLASRRSTLRVLPHDKEAIEAYGGEGERAKAYGFKLDFGATNLTWEG